MCLEQGRKSCWRDFFFFLWNVPLHQQGAGETGPQGVCLIANFLFLQQHLSLIQYCLQIQSLLLALGCGITLVSSFHCHVSAIGSTGEWGHPWAWWLCRIHLSLHCMVWSQNSEIQSIRFPGEVCRERGEWQIKSGRSRGLTSRDASIA